MNPNDGGSEMVHIVWPGGGEVFSVGSITWNASIIVDPTADEQPVRTVLDPCESRLRDRPHLLPGDRRDEADRAAGVGGLGPEIDDLVAEVRGQRRIENKGQRHTAHRPVPETARSPQRSPQ